MTKNKQTQQQSRTWCFTDFELLDFNKIYVENKDIIRAIGIGSEKCPKTNRRHFQGHIQFINKKRMGGVKSIFGTKKVHLEMCRGTIAQNIAYCTKDGTYSLYGNFIGQGHRTDLESIKHKLDTGSTMKNIADDHFGDYIRYHHGLQAYKKMVDKERTTKFREIDVTLVCGPTNTNKTRNAVEKNENAFKITGKNLKWWDGYEQEETLIIDEYNNDIGITELLNILDGYQLRLEIKGSFTYANWNKVIITTNLTPDEVHAKAKDEHRNAMFRRITRVKNIYATLVNPWACRGVLR